MSIGNANWPLVVDLDGNLVKANSLDETFLDALRRDPLDIWKLPIKLLLGRATLKAFLADKSGLEVDTWSVRVDFVEYVKQQFELGRKIVLETAADERIAEAIATRDPFIMARALVLWKIALGLTWMVRMIHRQKPGT